VAGNLSVVTPIGTTNTETFTVVNAPAATLNSVTPNSGARGAAVPVTLVGTNFTAGSTVAVAGTGVTVGAVNVANSTTINTTFTIAGGTTAALGGDNVTVTNLSGTPSNAATFTVLGPSLTGISPATGARGTTVAVSLTGNYLNGATAVTATGAGVSCTAPTISGGTGGVGETAATNCTVTAGAALAAGNLSVVTPNGTTNTETFTVTGPALTGINPGTGAQGATLTGVTLTGVDFALTGTTTVAVPGVTVSAVSVVNSTTITANFLIAANATPGAQTVTVTNPNGTVTLSNGFTVTAANQPTLATISPATGAQNTSVAVTLTGNNFVNGATVGVTGGATASGVTFVNPTTITANINVPAGAAVGTVYNVSVTTTNGTSGSQPFTVGIPTLATINPTSGLHGSVVPVTFTGANLTGATLVNVSGRGTGLSCSITGTPTATTVTANCTITALAPHQPDTLTITTPAGTTNSVTFTVN
jgi:hypothetical protein